MKSSSLLSVFKEAFSGWQKDRATIWSAALAYFTIFSLSPLLLLIVSIVGLVVSRTNIEQTLIGELQSSLGADSANFISTFLQTTDQPTTSIIGTVIGTGTLLLGAIGLFGQLHEMLNHIWGVTTKPHAGLMGLIRSRVLNFSMLGVIAFLLLVSFIASAVISFLGTYLSSFLPFSAQLLEIVNFIFSFAVITVLFAMILKVLPDVKIPWKNVWVSAMVTSLLFTVGKVLIGLFIGHTGTSTYGAASSLVVLLLWVYYSAQILFFGAEFTKAYTLSKGESIQPSKYAVLENPPIVEQVQPQNLILSSVVKHFFTGFIDEIKAKSPLSGK